MMNTFLPYGNFKASAQCLDNKRLGKQRVEVLQLVKAIVQGPECMYNIHTKKFEPDLFVKQKSGYQIRKTPWYHHPACKMWHNHLQALLEYGIVVCGEWQSRGFKDTVGNQLLQYVDTKIPLLPEWLGDKDFHDSHKSNLLRKDPIHYAKFAIVVPNNLPYIWPVV